MQAQVYLITPPQVGPEFSKELTKALSGQNVAAVLIQRGDREDPDYIEVAKALIPVAQAAGSAALLDNMPEQVTRLGADGVHMTGSAQDLRKTVSNLKPNSIVGAGGIHTKHDAMTKGELNVDYVFFGHLAGQSSDEELTTVELADWWADTFEIPSVCYDESADMSSEKSEFIAARDTIWQSDDAAKAILAIAGDLA